MRPDRLLCCLCLCVWITGCQPSSDPPLHGKASEEVAAPSWDEQLQAVRAEQGTELRRQEPLTPEQLNDIITQPDIELRIFEANFAQIPDELALRFFEQQPQLRQLILHGPVHDQLFEKFADLKELQILNIPEGEFTDEGLAQLAGHPQLRLLRFGSQLVSDAGLSMLSALPKLRFLHLINVPITDAGLEHLVPLTKLESFYLDGSRCTEAGLSEFIKQRRDLHFHWNQLHLPGDVHDHPH